MSAGGEEHPPAVVLLLVGDLADRRGLADAVDTDEQPDVRAALLPRHEVQLTVGTDETLLHLRAQRVEQLVGLGELLVLDPRPQAVEQIRGHADPDVGPQQRLLEVFPRLVRDPPAPTDAGEGTGQRRPGPRHPAAQGDRWGDDLGLDDLRGSSTAVGAPGRGGAVGGAMGGAFGASIERWALRRLTISTAMPNSSTRPIRTR